MKKLSDEEFWKLFIKCDNCGYYNKLNYIKKTGVCHCCNKILNK